MWRADTLNWVIYEYNQNKKTREGIVKLFFFGKMLFYLLNFMKNIYFTPIHLISDVKIIYLFDYTPAWAFLLIRYASYGCETIESKDYAT